MTDTFPALAALALSAFTSATLLPGTSEAALLALHLAGAAPAWLLLTVASLANIAGSCVNWALGRHVTRYGDRPWFPLSPEKMRRASAWYASWGWPSLFLAWMPVIGDPLTLVAGVMRTRFLQFLIVVAFAKTARYAALLWLADLF